MYYEEAEVKKYTTKNKKTGKERINFQINLTKESKFREPKKIGLIDLSEIEEIANNLDFDKLNSIKDTLEETSEEIVDLKKQINQLKEDKLELQEKVLEVEEERDSNAKELLSEKETSKGLLATLTKISNEKAEVEKENIFLIKRNWFNRLINTKYNKDDSKILPDDLEAKLSENQ